MKKIKIGDPDKLWFTSDTHFCHKNIIRFCDRPFETIEEHNQGLVDNWNSVVPVDADVWHLGDFCFGGSAEWYHLVGALNGRIHLVLGNHDTVASEPMLDLFESVHMMARLEVAGHRELWLSHFPLQTWPGKFYGKAWNLYGHIHSQTKPETEEETQYDVGVDRNEYKPVSYQAIVDIMGK